LKRQISSRFSELIHSSFLNRRFERLALGMMRRIQLFWIGDKSVANNIDRLSGACAEHTGYTLGNFKVTFFLRKLTPFSTRRARA
jgi:hypothetical protein